MLFSNSKQILKILGVLLIVVLILWHESGLQIRPHQMLKAMDIVLAYVPQGVRSVLGFPTTEGSIGKSQENGISLKVPDVIDYEVVEERGTINVKTFGAKGDGVADDTAAVQKAINSIPSSGGKVFIPAGTYMIEALQSIRLQSNVTLLMEKRAVLKAIPNRAERYAVLTIENVSNVTVIGGVIEGERVRHSGNKGQWGTGIQISGAKNITIKGTAANECWGDGFYIGTETFTGDDLGKILTVPENIQLIDVRANHNRRQGISVIAGRNVEILRPQLTNTEGQDPQAGIDIEPNDPTDIVENITVVDAFTKRNSGAGVLINLTELFGTKTPANIKIINHRDDGSERGMFMIDDNRKDNITPGNVLIENPEWVNAQKCGLSISNHDHRSYSIIVKNPHITNANRNALRFDTVSGSAIAIYHDRGNIPARTGSLGNITIYNPVITDTGTVSKTIAPFYIWDDIPGRPIQYLSIIDPVIGGSLAKVSISDGIKSYIKYTQ